MLHWLNQNAGAVTVIGTVVTAIATITYVVVSVFLWLATRDNARAARESADAARHSALVGEQAFEAAHRPFLGVSELRVPTADVLQELTVTMKNYGSIPLSFQDFEIEAVVDVPAAAAEERTGVPVGPYRQKFTARGQGLILAGETETFNCGLDHAWLFEIIRDGSATLRIDVVFRYKSIATGKEYEWRSFHRYDSPRGIFLVERASMT